MEFFKKNISWFLLLLFFILMLFLISLNQKADAPETPSSGSGNTVVSESGSIQELVNKIEAEEKIKQEEKREEKDSQENSEKQEAEMASGS